MPPLLTPSLWCSAIADESGLEALLGDLIANRHAVREFSRTARAGGGSIDLALRKGFGLSTDETDREPWPRVAGRCRASRGRCFTIISISPGKRGGEKVKATAEALGRASRERDPLRRMALLEESFLTKAEMPKADVSLIAAAMTKVAPDLRDAVALAQSTMSSHARDRLRVLRMFNATMAALTLAERLDADYEDLKKKRSQLDFEDLIARTAELLIRSDVGPWVHYKLDQGVDHILVDEAQDTSPIQWSVIRSLREEFFSGDSARTLTRTFFAVGDEKQSIYSFQGARPERFAEEAAATRSEVERSGEAFSSLRLPLSFRSTETVLTAVDQVFQAPDNARGLSAAGADIVHMSNRIGHPVRRRSLGNDRAGACGKKTEDWTAPFDATPESAPSAVLARRIAHAVEGLIGKETIVEKGVHRPIRPGDILVLVRKRDNFVNALTRCTEAAQQHSRCRSRPAQAHLAYRGPGSPGTRPLLPASGR